MIAAVNRAFERQHPGETTLGGGEDLPDHLNSALNKELGLDKAIAASPQQQPGAVDDPEVQAALGQIREQLQRDWGLAFEENLRDAQEVFNDYFPTDELKDRFVKDNDLARNVELQVEGVRYLAKLARLKKQRG